MYVVHRIKLVNTDDQLATLYILVNSAVCAVKLILLVTQASLLNAFSFVNKHIPKDLLLCIEDC